MNMWPPCDGSFPDVRVPAATADPAEPCVCMCGRAPGSAWRRAGRAHGCTGLFAGRSARGRSKHLCSPTGRSNGGRRCGYRDEDCSSDADCTPCPAAFVKSVLRRFVANTDVAWSIPIAAKACDALAPSTTTAAPRAYRRTANPTVIAPRVKRAASARLSRPAGGVSLLDAARYLSHEGRLRRHLLRPLRVQRLVAMTSGSIARSVPNSSTC